MTVTPLEPDIPSPYEPAVSSGHTPSFGDVFTHVLAFAGGALERADASERAFIRGHGGLQEMVVERARADAALSLAAATASRAAQSVSTILGMQV